MSTWAITRGSCGSGLATGIPDTLPSGKKKENDNHRTLRSPSVLAFQLFPAATVPPLPFPLGRSGVGTREAAIPSLGPGGGHGQSRGGSLLRPFCSFGGKLLWQDEEDERATT